MEACHGDGHFGADGRVSGPQLVAVSFQKVLGHGPLHSGNRVAGHIGAVGKEGSEVAEAVTS